MITFPLTEEGTKTSYEWASWVKLSARVSDPNFLLDMISRNILPVYTFISLYTDKNVSISFWTSDWFFTSEDIFVAVTHSLSGISDNLDNSAIVAALSFM